MNRCVVRVSSSTYITKRGLEYKRTATILKRKSNANFSDFSCDIVEYPPVNFHDVPDGLYEDGEVAFVLPDSGKEVPICAWRPLPFTARMALDERP